MDLRGDQMMRLADQVDPFSFDTKRAFVVQNAFQHHEARIYHVLRTCGGNSRIFQSVEEAERWIGDGHKPRP